MNSVEILRPDLSAIPQALKSRDAWVLWQITKDGKKVPFCAENLRPTDVTSFMAGEKFSEVAERYKYTGRFSGVGIILTGNELIGLDIDNCVNDGVISGAARRILKLLGCSYVEYSPSGRGLRGFGLASTDVSNVVGFYEGQKIEIYAYARYLTVTGRVCKEFGDGIDIGVLKDVSGLIHRLAPTLPTQETQVTEVTKVTQLTNSRQASYSISVKILDELPKTAIPTGYGQRNRCLFELARYLKRAYPEATSDDFQPLVFEWFNRYNAHIKTKDVWITLADFQNCLTNIKFLDGEALKVALELQTELPEWMASQCYGPKGEALLKICCALAKFHAPHPFFLSARKAGELIGLHFTDCSSLLRALASRGYLECLDKGTRYKAATYRISGPVNAVEDQEYPI